MAELAEQLLFDEAAIARVTRGPVIVIAGDDDVVEPAGFDSAVTESLRQAHVSTHRTLTFQVQSNKLSTMSIHASFSLPVLP